MKITRKKLHQLYYLEKKTTRQVAKELGVGQTTIRRWMKKFGMIARNSSESRIKHPRKSFSKRSIEKAYLLGLCSGDVSACKRNPFTIEVTTATTHPAMINLFCDVFGKYGHVFKWPRKSNLNIHQWALSCGLNISFIFLTEKSFKIPGGNEEFLSFLSGYSDAEGCWFISKSHYTGVSFRFILNTGDLEILNKIKEKLGKMGYHPTFRTIPIDQKQRGTTFRCTKALHELSLNRRKEIISLAKKMLPLSHHKEKIDKIDLMLKLKDKKYWIEVESKIKTLREKIKIEVNECVNQARLEYDCRYNKIAKPNSLSQNNRNFNESQGIGL